MASVPGVLDFIVPYILFNVQSATLAHPLWTSAYLNSASTSNPPCLLIHFGLPYAFPLLQCPLAKAAVPFDSQHTFPPLQHPIHRSCSSLLDFLVPYLRFNVQFTVYPHPPQKGVEFFAPLRSAQCRGPPDLVRPCPKTRLRHVLSTQTVHRGRAKKLTLSPFFLWTMGWGVEPLSENPFPVLLLS